MTAQDRMAKVLDLGEETGVLPTNVACKVGCRFCYEHFVQRDFDNLEFRAIPRYKPEVVDEFMSRVEAKGLPILPTSVLDISDGNFHMGPNADFFTLGLSELQIDRIIASNSERSPVHLYATGIGLDAALVHRLTRKHGRKFVLRLSALTFDDDLKSKIVRNWTPAETLKPIIKAAGSVRVMLLCLSYEQMIEDLSILHELKTNGTRVLVSAMSYTASYPADLKDLADEGFKAFPKVISHLVRNPRMLERFGELRFLHPPEAYAWKYRYFLRKRLSDVGSRDVVLSSCGAERVLAYLVKPAGTAVYGVPNPAGGSMQMATTLTSRAVLERLQTLIDEGYSPDRVFLPSSIWWAKGEYDLEAQTAETIKSAFPDIDFVVVPIPYQVLNSNLSLFDCEDYFKWEHLLAR